MNEERYKALSTDLSLELTEDEIRDGWGFCLCSWDGMLIHRDWPEAKFCECIQFPSEITGERSCE